MKIVVCIKQVPESSAPVTVEKGRVAWNNAPLVVNPWDEFALEAALAQKDRYGGSVTALSVGPESAREALRYALAMGCDEAFLINDPLLEGIDSLGLAMVLAAAIRKTGAVDLVLMGRQAIDTDLGVTAPQVARLLGWPLQTAVSEIQAVDLAARKIQVMRTFEENRQVLQSSLPLVAAVLKDIGDPRFPSFMGQRKSQKALIPAWTLADLGLSLPEPAVVLLDVMNPPQRQVKTEWIEGDSPAEIAAKLVEKLAAERVL